MFEVPFIFEDKKIVDESSLALFLKRNFKKCLSLISDNSLLTFLENQSPEIYDKVVALSKEYEQKENVLTLIIYFLDNKAGIVTSNHVFKSNFDIAKLMKEKYPEVDEDIKTLFRDKVLANIFWNEYYKTEDTRYKRTYTFMLHVYENRMYEFTYFYYLFLHLDRNETIRFTIDGVKMKELSEITYHLVNHIDRATMIIEEVLRNPYVIALMAIKSGIDVISNALNCGRSLEILKCLATYADVNLIPAVKRKMCFWLLSNYSLYTYETSEAKELYLEYDNLSKNSSYSTISDYVEVFDEATRLYNKFVLLFDHNKIIHFRDGITSSDELYLNYRFNDEYVCKKFLVENNLFMENIHTDIHRETVEREIIVDALENEKQEIVEFKEEVKSLTSHLEFDRRNLGSNLFLSIMYLVLSLVAIFGGLLLGNIKAEDSITQIINYSLFGLSGLSLLLFFISLCRNSKKLSDSDLINIALNASEYSVEEINKEEIETLNPNSKSNKHQTLLHMSFYKKNRKRDLAKIKKISKRSPNVGRALIIIGVILLTLPLFEFGLTAILRLCNVEMFSYYVLNINLNLVSIIAFAINTLLLIIFRKHKFQYYLIYLLILVVVLLSVLL